MEVICGERYCHAHRDCHKRAHENPFRDFYVAGSLAHCTFNRYSHAHLHANHHLRGPAQPYTHGYFYGFIDTYTKQNSDNCANGYAHAHSCKHGYNSAG
ncbi:hypothetical protein DFR64_1496 [Pelolinea submarina]|uniref:Uncharacterized protein n=1 Tax=Pelolinea submarina TaxID=913107 RepID=A0A3E0AJ02_9CHLR|nr:hypothetical protein DFR64_1496 [Pelolinea submarina]